MGVDLKKKRKLLLYPIEYQRGCPCEPFRVSVYTAVYGLCNLCRKPKNQHTLDGGVYYCYQGDAPGVAAQHREREERVFLFKSDFPTSPGSPRKAQPPVSGISNRHLQSLPGAFLTPKRPPKRCENATVRSQVGRRDSRSRCCAAVITTLPLRHPGSPHTTRDFAVPFRTKAPSREGSVY